MPLYSRSTLSLCPVCLKVLTAIRQPDGDQVYLEKTCPEHGPFRTLIWSGPPALESWLRPKVPIQHMPCQTENRSGCPFDCGLCPDHRQKTCATLIEVTSRCDLNCPICYAGSGRGAAEDPSLAAIIGWYDTIKKNAGTCNIQITGGEPTVRDDLPEIITAGRELGFPFLQLNTNGLRLAKESDYARRLKDAGLTTVFLQFDGTEDHIHQSLRGRNLLEEKLAAVEACSQAKLGIVLVPTLIREINTRDIGAILKLGMKLSPAVRGVHFQPLSYFGRYPSPPGEADHLTLPEILRALSLIHI